MIIHTVRQNTPEWLELRARHLCASDAPAMLGLSKYKNKTRAALLREKATGITPEVSAKTKDVFNAGHAAEAATRSWAETLIGSQMDAVTGSTVIEGLPLLASFDGLNLLETHVWENKLWNKELAAQVTEGVVPDTHWPQLEHQLLVSNAQFLLFTVSDGGDNIVHTWYESQPDRRAKVIAGWKQFVIDLEAYEHVESKPDAVAASIEDLPALMVQIEGRIVASNLDAFTATARAFLAEIKTELHTDQDFSDADKMGKFLKAGEDRLELVKAQALAQTSDIDALFRAIDTIREDMRGKRLWLEKAVKSEKENRKAELARTALDRLKDHLDALDLRIGDTWVTRSWGGQSTSVAAMEAIKGLKTLDSMRDKLDAWLAGNKIEASALADRIEANRKTVTDITLVPDFAMVCAKAPDDFAALLAFRQQQRAEAESKRQDAERARIEAEVLASATQPQPAKSVESVVPMATKPTALDAVFDAEPVIREFIQSRDWKKGEESKVRAVLIEYEKFKSTLMRKAA